MPSIPVLKFEGAYHGQHPVGVASLVGDRLPDFPAALRHIRRELSAMGLEHLKRLVGRLIEAFTEELGIKIQSVSSTTLNREDLRQGVEGDECYYVANEPTVRNREEIDLERDPPPDLVVEVEVTRRILGRIPIYAAMGIGELWRYDGETLRVCQLQKDGQYLETGKSQVFPTLPVKELTRFLGGRARTDETELVRSFRRWVRSHFQLD